MVNGWIKLHRKIEDNPYYHSEPFIRIMAWIDLLLLANHRDKFYYNRGVKVEVKRGQIGYSMKELSKRWKWSIGKVSRYLHDLEMSSQIALQKNNVTTIISITNYERYQADGIADSTANGTQIGSQTETNKNVKNIKNNIREETHALFSYVNGNCKSVQSMKDPLTLEQADRLISKYKLDMLIDTFNAMENKAGLLKKYTSANLTVQNWIKRELESKKNGRNQQEVFLPKNNQELLDSFK